MPSPTIHSKASCLETPAFVLDGDYPELARAASHGDGIHPLPGITVTVPALHKDGAVVGRVRAMRYTRSTHDPEGTANGVKQMRQELSGRY